MESVVQFMVPILKSKHWSKSESDAVSRSVRFVCYCKVQLWRCTCSACLLAVLCKPSYVWYVSFLVGTHVTWMAAVILIKSLSTPVVCECVLQAFEVRRPDARRRRTTCLLQLTNIARKRSFEWLCSFDQIHPTTTSVL